MHLLVTDLLQRVAPSSSSFTCVGAANARAYSLLRHRRDCEGFGERHWLTGLSALLPIDCEQLVTDERRTYRLSEFEAALRKRSQLELLEHRNDVLLVVLHSWGTLHGLLGLERSHFEPRFTDEEQRQVEALAEVVSLTAGLWVTSGNLACENAVLRALGSGDGLLMLADAEARTVYWAGRHGHGLDRDSEVTPVVSAALQATRNRATGKPHALDSELEELADSLVVTTASVEVPELDLEHCTAIRVSSAAPQSGPDTLSPREREVALLLMDGYANVNIAAITGLSENTIRTYVRRLYRKLGVCNRIELMRAMPRRA